MGSAHEDQLGRLALAGLSAFAGIARMIARGWLVSIGLNWLGHPVSVVQGIWIAFVISLALPSPSAEAEGLPEKAWAVIADLTVVAVTGLVVAYFTGQL